MQRLEEGLFGVVFGVGMHVWRPFDSRFRLITARRNPNLLLLTASMLFGRPDLGIIAVAAWTALSLLVHTRADDPGGDPARRAARCVPGSRPEPDDAAAG